MQPYYIYFLLPVLSSLIGWFTNVIAIRLLFRPYRAIRFLKWTFQGMLPKHRDELAVSIGEIVNAELISAEEIAGKIAIPEVRNDIKRVIADITRRRLEEKVPFFIPKSVSSYLLDLIVDTVRAEVDDAMEDVLSELLDVIHERVNIAEIVRDKISSLELERLEGLVYEASGRELRHIELLGAVIGFLVGFVQVFLMTIL